MSGPCTRPECGGEVHTDGWGTPIQCPARRCPRCDCPDGAEQCEHCKVCPHADRADGSNPSTAVELGAALRAARGHLDYWQQRVDQLDRQVGRFIDREAP
jgi:hypothetical protein